MFVCTPLLVWQFLSIYFNWRNKQNLFLSIRKELWLNSTLLYSWLRRRETYDGKRSFLSGKEMFIQQDSTDPTTHFLSVHLCQIRHPLPFRSVETRTPWNTTLHIKVSLWIRFTSTTRVKTRTIDHGRNRHRGNKPVSLFGSSLHYKRKGVVMSRTDGTNRYSLSSQFSLTSRKRIGFYVRGHISSLSDTRV